MLSFEDPKNQFFFKDEALEAELEKLIIRVVDVKKSQPVTSPLKKTKTETKKVVVAKKTKAKVKAAAAIPASSTNKVQTLFAALSYLPRIVTCSFPALSSKIIVSKLITLCSYKPYYSPVCYYYCFMLVSHLSSRRGVLFTSAVFVALNARTKTYVDLKTPFSTTSCAITCPTNLTDVPCASIRPSPSEIFDRTSGPCMLDSTICFRSYER